MRYSDIIGVFFIYSSEPTSTIYRTVAPEPEVHNFGTMRSFSFMFTHDWTSVSSSEVALLFALFPHTAVPWH
jgi:hypothetical protein